MSSNLGRKLLLHCVPFPQISNDEDRFVSVEIVEVKTVKGNYSPDAKFEGWKAKGEDGKYYTVNWEYFDESSTSPCWMWYCEDTRTAWYDITQGLRNVDFRPKWLDKYKDIIYWCESHQSLNTKDGNTLPFSSGRDSYCFQCRCGLPAVEKPVSEYWKGWK